MKTPRSRLQGYIEISIASVGFGFLGFFGKQAYSAGLSVGEVLSYRFALAGLLIWIFLLLFKRSWIVLTIKQTLIASLLGICGYAFFSTLYFKAIEGLSVTLAALLLYTYPFWVNIFSHFFTHDKISKKEALCLIGASVGLVLLLWGHIEIKNGLAVAAGLGSAISYAIYVLLSGRLQKDVRPLSSTLYVITFGAVALFAFHTPDLSRMMAFSWPQIEAILGLAVICTIIPLTLELSALQKIRSKEVALVMMLEPITACILGVVLLREHMSLQQLIGALLILAALILNSRQRRTL